jgi:hypothetical protein
MSDKDEEFSFKVLSPEILVPPGEEFVDEDIRRICEGGDE